ncbi:MAG: glycosyltransferase [Christensenellales bacterium]|jgi:glycosyltransferase involved in cell wall biosynthesis
MRPRVCVLMAVYRPDPAYLKQQLLSIEQQDYENLYLYIREDCGGETQEVLRLARDCLDKVPFSLDSNEKNLGSTKTFELLTQKAQGDYFAYCDQDDVWETDKISKLMQRASQGPLVYSDLSVIDGAGNKQYDSFRQMRRRIRHLHGEGLTSFFLRRNCVTGCTMLMRASAAKAAAPFPAAYVHDHWLALCASAEGPIAYCPEALVRYRVHGKNQIGAAVLKDTTDRDDYIAVRLQAEREKYETVLQRFAQNAAVEQMAWERLACLANRERFLKKPRWASFGAFCRGAREDFQLFVLELALAILPKAWGRHMLRRIK